MKTNGMQKGQELIFPDNLESCKRIISEQRNRILDMEASLQLLKQNSIQAEKQYLRLQEFYKYAPTGYVRLSKDGSIQDLNGIAAACFNKTCDELRNTKLIDFLDPKSQKDFPLYLAQLLTSEDRKGKIFTINRQDKNIHLLVDGLTFNDQTEVILEIVDISEKSGPIDVVDQFKSGQYAFLDELAQGIVILDNEEHFLYVNSSIERLFDAPASLLIQKKLSDFIAPPDLSPQEQIEYYGLESKKTWESFDIISAREERKSIAYSEAPYYNWKGQQIGKIKVFADITEEKKRSREIQKRLVLEIIVSEVSNEFVHLKREYLDLSLNRALQKIGEFAEVDRSYIFLFSEDGLSCNNTHEWCATGIEPQLENLQGIPTELMPWWMEKLNKFETVHIPLVSEMPQEAQAEREILEAQDIQSVLVIPLLTSEKTIGFIGFDSVVQVKNWKNEDITLLYMLGEIIGNGFERLRFEEMLIASNALLEQKVEERTRNMKELMELNKSILNNSDLIIVTADKHGIINTINPYGVRKLGYSPAELIGRPAIDLMNEPHFIQEVDPHSYPSEPVDTNKKEALVNYLKKHGHLVKEWNIISKHGQKMNVLVSFSVLKDEKDEVIGYTSIGIDNTERKKNETYGLLSRDLGFSLAATSTIQEALDQVINVVLKIEGIGGVGIYLIDEDKEKLDLASHKGFSEEFIQRVKSYDKQSAQYKMVTDGVPVYGNHRDILSKLVRKSAAKFTILNQVGIIPIRHEVSSIGTLNVSIDAKEGLSTTAKIALEIIASQIGGTLARIHSENALRISQKNFHLMFDTIDDFLFILDAAGNIIKTNPVVENRLGYTREELQGMSVMTVHPPLRREEAGFIVGEMLAGNRDFCPVPLYCKDGSEIPVETKVVMGKWDGKDALYGISRDISQRIKAADDLRISEERWHFALEGSGDGVWDWHIQTNEVYFSKQWKKMLGFEIDEIKNHLDEWEKRVHPEDIEQTKTDIQLHLEGKTEVYSNEHRMLCKDGSYIWIHDRGKVVEFDENGNPHRIIGTHTNITPRKELEEQLRQAIEKEKELNELKSRFVSTASHEFRTPLASILMVSETLILYQSKLEESQISLRLHKIKEHVLHLTNIVNDVLQISRMQEGKIGFNPQEHEIVGLCTNIIEGFNSTILAKGKLSFITPNESLIALLDHRMFTQMLNNLISNAIKYSDGTPDIKVELIPKPNEWIIQVSDHGIGIPETDLKYLFKPFFRASNVSNIQGNGLGLNIVYESVKMHGGEITVESEVHKGSIFTLRFPM